MAELSRLLHFRYRLVAKIVELLQHARQINLLARLQCERGRRQF